jgi:NAD(P)-dependent dehydrogenase (short-subunit alcohol dehydrogenase family)
VNCRRAPDTAQARKSRCAGQFDGALAAFPRAEAYGASKAALSWFADSLRLDWEPKGIAVTVVSPGFVDTPLTRKNDFAMPGQVSVGQAVTAIRRGLAKGKNISRFRALLGCCCARSPLFPRLCSGHSYAGWYGHEHCNYW